jgi:hypothetical protein
MAQIPLNTFKLVTKEVTTNASSFFYSASLGTSGIILSIQLANKTNTVEKVYAKVKRSGSAQEFFLLSGSEVPPNDALNPLGGRLILEQQDQLIIFTETTGKIDGVVSVLENANV